MSAQGTVRRARLHRAARREATAYDRWHGRARDDQVLSARLLSGFAVLAPAVVTVVGILDTTPRVALTLGVLFAAAELPVLSVVLPWLRREQIPRAAEPPAQADGQGSVEPEVALEQQDLLHELRSTVVGIVLTHELLHDAGPELGDQRRGRLELLEDAELHRLERMVAPEARSAPHGLLAVAPVIESSVEAFRVRGSDIHWAGTDAVADVGADDLAEVLHILLDNAQVHAPGAPVAIAVASDGEHTTVTVTDRGPGVPERAASQVFERGFRTGGHPGQGLGLDLARRLAHRMDGEIALEPTPCGGCTFVLRVPARRKEGPWRARSA